MKKLLKLFLLIIIAGVGYSFLSGDNGFSAVENLQEQYAKSVILSEAIDETPLSGLHVTVPEAAMDRKLKLVANRLSAQQITENNPYAPYVGPIVAAYEINLGLLPEERLMKPMQISFNLNEMGLPKEEWKNLQIFRVDKDKTRISVFSKLDGNELKVFTTKNPGFEFALIITGTVTAFYHGVGLYRKGTMDYLAVNSVMEDGTTYRLLWPEDLKPANKELLNKIKAKYLSLERNIKAEIEELNVSDNRTYVEKVVEAVQKRRETEDFKDMNSWTAKLLNSSGFPPYEVRRVESALKDIHVFYTTVKCLPPKNVLGIDIVIRTGSTWPHTEDPKAVAMSVNPQGSVLPYVDIHVDNISDQDELYLNLTHELFHVLQEDYYYLQGMRSAFYVSFLEGTAVLAEYEALKYFSDPNFPGKPRLSKNAKPTDRDFYITLSRPMEDDEASTQRHHGYTMSHFLEYLRDKHSANKEQYLKKIMDAFGSTYSFSTNKALCRSVNMKAGDFSQVSCQYCTDNAKLMADSILIENTDESRRAGKDALFKDISQEINFQKPLFEWDYPVEKPLSCEYRFINIQVPQDSESKDLKLLINDEMLKKQSIKLRFSLNGNDKWQDYTSGGIAIDAVNLNKLTLQRISPMVEKSWLFSASGKSQIAIMFPPDTPLVEKLEGDKVTITIKESILAKNGLIKGYKLFIKAPGATEPVIHDLNKSDLNKTFILPDFERISSSHQFYKMPYEIYYRETATTGGEEIATEGPESGRAQYCIVEDQFAGRYVGKSYYDAKMPDTLQKARAAQLEKHGQLSFVNDPVQRQKLLEEIHLASQKQYHSTNLIIGIPDKDGNYSIEAQLPGMTLKGYLRNAGIAHDKWATRYIITDKKLNRLGLLDVVTREGMKTGQEALLLELNISDKPSKFEMVENGFPQFSGYFYKDGKKPKWKDSESALKELFN